MERKPFFYDVTLRDANQALKKPWNTAEKEIIFKILLDLGVQGIEVGFSGSSDMDFEACQHLASIAPNDVVISGLARTVQKDIDKVAEAIKSAAKPRIHTFVTLSPFHMKYVLNKEPQDVRKIAVDAVRYAKSLIGEKGEVQFSAEHFGDCKENISFVIDSLQEIVEAGANIINLPNTVERSRPKDFVDLVSQVKKALPSNIIIAVHCHNDLGMATATTVESYFAGATQLEVCLNGLGERAGNTNLYEVAVSLYNCSVDVPLNLSKIYETALLTAEKANEPIYEKSPLIGPDALAHRSGIHQDGALKTKDMEKGAYRPIHPSLIGRDDDEKLCFTSQSGKTAVYEIITRAGYPITMEEAVRITPKIKESAEKVGELPTRNIVDIYFKEIFKVKGSFVLNAFNKIDEYNFDLVFTYKDKSYNVIGTGDGPLSACIDALEKAGFPQKLLHYEQLAVDEEINGVNAEAMTIIKLQAPDGSSVTCRSMDKSTANANVKAIFNGLNLIENNK
ncbi:MAG: 2-isopropylmalate synthase LeuA2 [Candidatus Gastranaerophilaceae bacterium]|jgi:2-isopropylmalate synthase